MNPPGVATPSFRLAAFRMQEGGLLLVILALGAVLTFFGGSVEVPLVEKGPDGEPRIVRRANSSGEEEVVKIRRNKFLNPSTLAQLAKDTSFVAIMAVGATFVIIAGQIDLSVGAIYALASVLGALVFHAYGANGTHSGSHALGTALGTLACVGVATLCGAANGAMVVALRVHPFIITLGTMAIYRGAAFIVTKGQSIGDFPETFTGLVKWKSFGDLTLVPLGVMLLVAVAGGIYLARLAVGRRIYAVGGNELASRYSGINVERVKLSVFLFSGLTAGIAALLAIGYYGSASSGDGAGYELDVIAAAVVGGASLSGGRGTALGALLGALVIKMIDSGIVILGIEQNYSRPIIGAAVILAVVLDQLNAWLARQRLAKTS